MNDPATARAEGAPAHFDLTGVDPIHWAETRRRVAILREWCAVKRHSRAQCVTAAARMGVSIKHFERLVATWKRFGEARRVSGSAARRGEPRGTLAMPTATRTAVDEAISALGPAARFTDVLAEADRRCRAAGTPSASYGMVHYLQMRARAEPATAEGDDREIRVARVACILPVAIDGDIIQNPELVLAVSVPSGIVVAHLAALDGDAVAAARDVLQRIREDRHLPVTLAANLAGAVQAKALDAGAEVLGSPRNRARIIVATASELLTTIMGSHIDSIPIRHRRSIRIRPWPADPLTREDAIRAIDQAIAAHNRARAKNG